MESDKELDVRHLRCPLPILKAKRALATMSSGEVLCVTARDRSSLQDFEAFARQTGNCLLKYTTLGEDFSCFLRKR